MIRYVLIALLFSAAACSEKKARPERDEPSEEKKVEETPSLPEDPSKIKAYFAKHGPKDLAGLAEYTGQLQSKLYGAGLEAGDVESKLQAVYDRYGRLYIEIGLRRQKMTEKDVARFDGLRLRMSIRYSAAPNMMALSKKMLAAPSGSQSRQLYTDIMAVASWWNLENVKNTKGAEAHFQLTIPKAAGHLSCDDLLTMAEMSAACGASFTSMDKRLESGSGSAKCIRTYDGPNGEFFRFWLKDQGSAAAAKRRAGYDWESAATKANYAVIPGLGDQAMQLTDDSEPSNTVRFLKGNYDVRLDGLKAQGKEGYSCSLDGLTKLAKSVDARL